MTGLRPTPDIDTRAEAMMATLAVRIGKPWRSEDITTLLELFRDVMDENAAQVAALTGERDGLLRVVQEMRDNEVTNGRVISHWFCAARRAEAAIEAAKALHRPVRIQTGTKTHGGPNEYGEACSLCGGRSYPCPTAAALVVPVDDRQDEPTIYDEVRAERERAHAKHADTSMESAPADDPTGRRFRILVEEVGEVGKEFNDAEHDQRPVDLSLLRKELIQTAAMATAWADVIPTREAPNDDE